MGFDRDTCVRGVEELNIPQDPGCGSREITQQGTGIISLKKFIERNCSPRRDTPELQPTQLHSGRTTESHCSQNIEQPILNRSLPKLTEKITSSCQDASDVGKQMMRFQESNLHSSKVSGRPRSPSPSLQRQLQEENQSLRDESTCKVCLDNPSCIVFLPCGHLVTCAECTPALRMCPVCRALISGTVRAYNA